jgi:biopolymer transport protein ExbB/TolQ
LDDPDLQQLLKQAQEMQKSAKNPGSQDTRKKLAEMEAMAKEEAAQQDQEEKEKLRAALKKQLEAPGPVTFPDWSRSHRNSNPQVSRRKS